MVAMPMIPYLFPKIYKLKVPRNLNNHDRVEHDNILRNNVFDKKNN